MRSHTNYRNFPLTYSNYFILFTGVVVILFSGWLHWVASSQRQQMKDFSSVSTTEVTGTVKSIHRPRTLLGGRFLSYEDTLEITLNEYKTTFELQEFWDNYGGLDLLLSAENNDSVTVTLTVDEEELQNGLRFVSVYGVAVDGENVFTKEDYLHSWEEDSGDFLYMEVGCALTGLVFLAWGWFWREKPKYYSPFSRY